MFTFELARKLEEGNQVRGRLIVYNEGKPVHVMKIEAASQHEFENVARYSKELYLGKMK